MDADIPPPLNPSAPMGAVSRFLVWSGGASPRAAQLCPEPEQQKLKTVGISVLMTSILAFASGGFAAGMVADVPSYGIGIGAVWCLFIFTLDRGMVSTIKPGNWWSQAANIMVRLLLATFLATTVSRPLELWVFRTEIADQLQDDAGVAAATAAAEVRDGTAGTAASLEEQAKQQMERTEETLTECRALEHELRDDYANECAGIGRTGRAGPGKECGRTKGFYDSQVGRCDAIKSSFDANVGAWRAATAEVTLQAQIRATEAAAAFSEPSLPMRHGALNRLTHEGTYADSLLWLNLFLFAIFWLVEVIPVLTKWLMVVGGHLDTYFYVVGLMSQHARSHLASAETAIQDALTLDRIQVGLREKLLEAFADPANATEAQGVALIHLERQFLERMVPMMSESVENASSEDVRRTSKLVPQALVPGPASDSNSHGAFAGDAIGFGRFVLGRYFIWAVVVFASVVVSFPFVKLGYFDYLKGVGIISTILFSLFTIDDVLRGRLIPVKTRKSGT